MEPISIHAPHARSDLLEDMESPYQHGISIHAPHARSDKDVTVRARPIESISIHAPHARSDYGHKYMTREDAFQSTLLMRGATRTNLMWMRVRI